MSHIFLANLWYYLLVLVWAIYISQELFVSGVGMLSLYYKVDDPVYKKVNESVGTFWDGIQVWVIVAIGGLFATFPTAYALTLQALYIPFFLLIFTIIFRGTSIELIFKSPDPAWQRVVSKIWSVSSLILIVVEGVYLFNLVVGLPLKDGLMTESFFVIFSRGPLLGALVFILSGLSVGYAWLKMTLGKDFETPPKNFILWISGSLVFIVTLLFLSLTNEYVLFETGLFVDNKILWILPILTIILYIFQFVFHLRGNYRVVFIFITSGIFTLLFTVFSASFPYILPSTIDSSEGLLIIEAASTAHTLSIITVVALITLPVVIGYQTWKYVKFGRKF